MKLECGWQDFTSDGQPVRGWAARPAAAQEPLPGVVVLHEAFGVDAHLRDVTERLAAAGFAAFAPDLHSVGGKPAALSEERVEEAKAFQAQLPPEALFDAGKRAPFLAKLDPARRAEVEETFTRVFSRERPWERWVPAMRAARAHLAAGAARGQPVGAVGFCMGGAAALRLACAEPALAAAVVFYGASPPLEQLAGLRAHVLAHYAEQDPDITGAVPALLEGMRAGAKHFEHHIYPGTRHGFFNDTRARYHPTAARHAWARTLAFLAHTLHEAHVDRPAR